MPPSPNFPQWSPLLIQLSDDLLDFGAPALREWGGCGRITWKGGGEPSQGEGTCGQGLEQGARGIWTSPTSASLHLGPLSYENEKPNIFCVKEKKKESEYLLHMLLCITIHAYLYMYNYVYAIYILCMTFQIKGYIYLLAVRGRRSLQMKECHIQMMLQNLVLG